MQKDRKTSENQNHDQADPLHGIDLAVAIVNPEDLTDRRNHGNNSCGVDITKLEGDKEKDNWE